MAAPASDNSWTMVSHPPRNIMICAEDTAAAAAATEWAVDNVWRNEKDLLHFCYVVKCLQPPMEVFHSAPGTSYAFQQPDQTHSEQRLIQVAKERLDSRLLPVLRPKMVPYQMHLYAERVEAPATRVGELILKCAEERDAALVVVAAHNKPSGVDHTFTGSVAEWIMANCKRPLAVYRPQ